LLRWRGIVLGEEGRCVVNTVPMIIGGFIVKVQTLRDVPFWYEGGVFGLVTVPCVRAAVYPVVR
jgi:hypothetical protein